MRLTTTLLLAALPLLGCAARAVHDTSPAAAPTPNPAMLKLFNGRDLSGWVGQKGKAGLADVWTVKDGAIDGNTDKGGFLLYTAGDYDHFRLILQSRLVSEKNHLGVCFWGNREANFGYGNCILVIPPDGGMWDYIINNTPKRDKFPHDPPFDPHQWHRTEILANRTTGEVQVAVNGFQTTRYVDADPTRLKTGPIGLQLHGGASQVQYKDLEIEVNPQENRLITLKP